MLSFLKKIFGSKPAEETPAPYKIEKPVGSFPLSAPYDQPAAEKQPQKKTAKKPQKKTADQKPAAKKTSRKPKASK